MLSKSKYTYTTFNGKTYTYHFELNEVFISNLFEWDYKHFIDFYEDIFSVHFETYIDKSRYNNGYVDLRNEEYYLCPTLERWYYDYELKSYILRVVDIEDREDFFLEDARNILKINGGISREGFVFGMLLLTFKYYNNVDKKLDKIYIIDKCGEIWDYYFNIDNYVDVKNKMFKIDKEYWRKRGFNNWLVVSSKIKSRIKKSDFSKYYSEEMTIEENLEFLKSKGIRTKKNTLIDWCEECGYFYITNKEKRNSLIIEVYLEDTSRSSRNIENILKDKGCKVTKDTIIKVIKDFNKETEMKYKIKRSIHKEISKDGGSPLGETPLTERSEVRKECLKIDCSLSIL